MSGVAGVTVNGNVLHFEFTNGTSADMTFTQPKDSYDYAVQAGYGGTKDEFSKKMKYLAELDLSKLGGTSGNGGLYTSPAGGVERTLGGISKGTAFKDANMQKMFDELFKPAYTSQVVSMSLSPNVGVYDKLIGAVNSVIIKTSITKKSSAIKSIKFYKDNTLLETITSDVANGGEFQYTYNAPFDTNSKFRVVVNDGTSDVEVYKNITFIPKSYYGYLSEGTAVTEDNIKTLTSALRTTATMKLKGQGMYNSFAVYAYPKSLGALATIKDTQMGFNYADTFTKIDITIDGEPYICYYATDSSTLDNTFEYQFGGTVNVAPSDKTSNGGVSTGGDSGSVDPAVIATINAHIASKNNPHEVSKEQLGITGTTTGGITQDEAVALIKNYSGSTGVGGQGVVNDDEAMTSAELEALLK